MKKQTDILYGSAQSGIARNGNSVCHTARRRAGGDRVYGNKRRRGTGVYYGHGQHA